jgi:hypothetical protein
LNILEHQSTLQTDRQTDRKKSSSGGQPEKSGTEAMHAAAAIVVEPSQKKLKLERRKSLQTD